MPSPRTRAEYGRIGVVVAIGRREIRVGRIEYVREKGHSLAVHTEIKVRDEYPFGVVEARNGIVLLVNPGEGDLWLAAFVEQIVFF